MVHVECPCGLWAAIPEFGSYPRCDSCGEMYTTVCDPHERREVGVGYVAERMLEQDAVRALKGSGRDVSAFREPVYGRLDVERFLEERVARLELIALENIAKDAEIRARYPAEDAERIIASVRGS